MKNSKLDDLKGKQPFRVPEGYMAGLTNQIMDRLPELPKEEEPQSVSLMDRIRPWLYLAAVFIGMGLFFRVIVDADKSVNQASVDSLLVQSEVSEAAVEAIDADISADDADYLEYIEDQYNDYLFQESLTDLE
mgnify:FL=1